MPNLKKVLAVPAFRTLAALVLPIFWPATCFLSPAQSQDARPEALSTTVPKSPILQTVAERSQYERTATNAEVDAFLETIAKGCRFAKHFSIGKTTESRPINAMLIASDPNVKLPLPASDPRICVCIVAGIHSGECDSKEALLALCREWLTDSPIRDSLLESMVLVVIPNFNADGNERVGTLHRPGQDGPNAGMGTRENAMGLDLNRDFVKLETPEVRSLVRIVDAWDIDVLIDAHTTNGSLHRYDLTYDVPHNPAANPSVVKWLRNQFLPSITHELEQQSLPTFYYGNFSPDYRRWESFGHEPRYSTEYMGLRGKIGILVESYSYATYKRRIDATKQFIEACLKQLAKEKKELLAMLDKPRAPDEPIPIQAEIMASDNQAVVKGFAWKEPVPAKRAPGVPVDEDHQDKSTATTSPSNIGSFPTSRDRHRVSDLSPKDYSVDLVNVGKMKLQVDAPKFYFIPYENAWAAGRLRMHGISLREFTPNVDSSGPVPCTRYSILTSTEAPSFQGHKLRKVAIKSELSQWNGEPGWIVDTDQPLGKLAVYLLEPHSDDGLAVWNFFDPELKAGATYPIVRLEALPKSGSMQNLRPLAWDELTPRDMVRESLSLEKLFASSSKVSYLSPPVPMPVWIPDAMGYAVQQGDRTFAVDCQTGAMVPLELPTKFANALAKHAEFSEGKSKSAARLSAFDSRWKTAMVEEANDLFLYQTETDTVVRITESPKAKKRVATLSPDGKHVAFVQDNNLWTVDTNSKEAEQWTSDGNDEILNGYLDWVYQEEIYGRGKFQAYWWSPDGKKIAFLRLDESPVPTFLVDNSLSFAQTLETMRYPKAGQSNPRVTLHIADLETKRITEVSLADYEADDRLVVRVGWNAQDPELLVYQVQNRIQSFLHVWTFDTKAKTQRKWITEESQAWVDVIDEPKWLRDGGALWLSDSLQGRRQLVRISPSGERDELTEANWDVHEIAWYDAEGTKAIVTGRYSDRSNMDVLSIDLKTKKVVPLSSKMGTHQVSVHSSGEFFFDQASSHLEDFGTWLCDRDGNRLRWLGGAPRDRMDYVRSANPERFTIAARDGLEMPALLYRPVDWKERVASGKLPVVIHVYGGPQAPTVANSRVHRSDLWHRWLAEQGIAVLLCDNRSALGRGNADTWKIYKDLGRVELLDLEDAVSWLKNSEWADGDRVGIWGWSYGGYFTAYAMTHSQSFKAGIAGAPVTDWRNYDSIYTERYMSTPEKNPAGYRSSSVVESAKDLHGKLMILHGEIDDNVHIANTFQLVHALQKAGKHFEMMVYPGNRHGITDPNQSEHQYRLMSEFFLRELQSSERQQPRTAETR